MIIGDINNISSEEFLNPKIREALDYLRKTDLNSLENGKHEIQGENFYMLILEFDTKPKQENKAEVHKNFLDIHFTISGKESIGFALENEKNEVIEQYSEETDVELYSSLEDESNIIIKEGTYAIFFPGEIHRPGCNSNGSSTTIKKAVVRISKDL